MAPTRTKRRKTTIYDAIAGRVNYQGFIDTSSGVANGNASGSSILSDDDDDDLAGRGAKETSRGRGRERRRRRHGGSPVGPEEALFRAKRAPEPNEDDDEDIYNADRYLDGRGGNSGTQLLPDSDLLKTVHAYAADFYARATADGGERDFASMDETALLACGILLEEACAEILGREGHMVFTELVKVEQQSDDDHQATNSEASIETSDATQETSPPRKRTRLGDDRSQSSQSPSSIDDNYGD